MIAVTLVVVISFLSGCAGYFTRKSPEELAKTPDKKLCDQFFFITGDRYASSFDAAKVELQVIYAEFSRRGIPPEEVTFHCAHQTSP